MAQIEDSDYLLDGNQKINNGIRGLIEEILTELEKDPSNEFLAYLARELSHKRIMLAEQGKFAAEILPSRYTKENIEHAANVFSSVQQDSQSLEVYLNKIQSRSESQEPSRVSKLL